MGMNGTYPAFATSGNGVVDERCELHGGVVLKVRGERKKFGDDCLPRPDLIGRLGRPHSSPVPNTRQPPYHWFLNARSGR